MLPEGTKVFLALGVTDLRKSIDGLCGLVQELNPEELFTGSLFVFCNRARNRIKALYWDENGWCLWMKRLEQDRFRWPKQEEEVWEINRQSLTWLLAGLDLSQAHERLFYKRVS
jgi:transposase